MPRVGTVDERFQSYNIEAVEVTGGRFWKPYASVGSIACRQRRAGGQALRQGWILRSMNTVRRST